ncbi:NAD(P)H dehydrogenase (quinone):NADPH-dependent FMN reductase [Streptomyces davaonensis JCM 4913]|uniref:NAD(P)H dehydrogenase (Quinone):NADPH-dependent FMN reductase n=1 Tax=Streptomyces davaonensis (strain DSM 101723 / JCM 4913 / KCC S-0913 / 768) TaxID=1214101 RepID=K4R493_STRDJ|nr:NAD(P)H-dependent oxidoreductase [Streptomyces davaonensis]CCK28168.1 NAD(P)H dehydrogenase (quinone):NADPH-dependent FMN reductase [Streptomyces davaonensis JCM 4913]
MTRRFLFVLGSSRSDGNTELLARRAAEQLPKDVEQQWIDLTAHPLPDFEDLRHDSDRVRPTEGNVALLLDATLAATDIVIASPLYWYTLSAQTKRYLDYWAGWLRTPGLDFKATLAGRTLWGVTALAEYEPKVADPLIGSLNNSAAYMGMRFGGVLLGNGSKPGDVLNDGEALARAKTFFQGETPLARYAHES